MAVVSAGAVPSGSTRYTQPFATDYFEGFSVVDSDLRIPQKKPSFWNGVDAETSAEQMALAREYEKEGSLRAARRAYDALVREWPHSKEAMDAQYAVARIFEESGNLKEAFDEYQYLVAHYAGLFSFDEVQDRQWRIANALLNEGRSFLGIDLGPGAEERERFEKMVCNAPRSPRVPEMMLVIGGMREDEKDYKEAISVYDGLLNRFPKSPQAPTAAYLDAKCRYLLSLENDDNEDRCRNSLAFFKSLLERMPNHPSKDDLLFWQGKLQELLLEQNYQQAIFYERRRPAVAESAYTRFLSEFGTSKYAEDIKSRLEALRAARSTGKE